jgi:hypothetical protein
MLLPPQYAYLFIKRSTRLASSFVVVVKEGGKVLSSNTHTTNEKHGLLGLLILSKEETTKGVEAESSISAGCCSSEHLFLQNALQVV